MQEISKASRESSARIAMQSIRSRMRKGQSLLVVLCGPSHAGKSTFGARLARLSDNVAVVSPDDVRRRLGVRFGDPEHEPVIWHIYESAKCRALQQGRHVVLDACHMSEQARWHALQGLNSRHRKVCVMFDVPRRIVRERALRTKRVPLGEVKRMWDAFRACKPAPDGLRRLGFDDVHVVRGCPASYGWIARSRDNAGPLVSGERGERSVDERTG